MSFNIDTLWCNHKTFIKYSQGDAVNQQYIYLNDIYLQIKSLYSGVQSSLQSVEQSNICEIIQ